MIAFEPPRIAGAPFGTKLPQVDADGNEVAGVRNPVQLVPLGTYFGWNLSAGPEMFRSSLQGMMHGLLEMNRL